MLQGQDDADIYDAILRLEAIPLRTKTTNIGPKPQTRSDLE